VAVLRIGLTGGIGSGKSEVSGGWRARCRLIDATWPPGRSSCRLARAARIAETFGTGVLRPDGSLNRERLGEIVFGDPELRVKLNEIVHRWSREWMQAAEQAAGARPAPPGPVVVHERPAAGGEPRPGGLRRGDRGGRAARGAG